MVLVVLYEFVLTPGHGFLNQSLTVTIVRNRIDMKVLMHFCNCFYNCDLIIPVVFQLNTSHIKNLMC